MKERYEVTVDPECGYRRLEPLPTAEETEDFYRERYYDLVAAGGRAPDVRRCLQGGEEAQTELAWLSQTLWKDIRDTLADHMPQNPTKWLLDIGCAAGHFGRYMVEHGGWHVVGVEPSTDAAEVARSLGLSTYASIEDCLRERPQLFDAVSLLHVLEHVVDPISLLQKIRDCMHVQGILVIEVPNDFTPLQECAQKKLNKDPWWISIPDHIHYFNFHSLEKLLGKVGFKTVDRLSDFPMELFLLLGEDYVGSPEVGSLCHKKRVAFELSLPCKLRRDIYRCFAGNGIGRNCLVFAKPTRPSRKSCES